MALLKRNSNPDLLKLPTLIVRKIISSLQLSSKHDDQPSERILDKHIRDYQRGKNRLAEMMGKDQATFSNEDVKDSLEYLLPTRLSAADARPFLKHPAEVYPERKKKALDTKGRPLEPAFFTGSPSYHNLVYDIYKEMKVSSEFHKTHSYEWIKKSSMSNLLAEHITQWQYEDLTSRLSELACRVNTASGEELLKKFCQPLETGEQMLRKDQGNPKSVGRRKTSTAVVTLNSGTGNVTVNKTSLLEYFPLYRDRQQILFPLTLTNTLGTYDLTAVVRGGGTTGQAGAIRLAVSKALFNADCGNYGKLLESAGLLKRDSRMVERKKPGQKKARKKFTWVKR